MLNILSGKQFLRTKDSDTLCILGCGWSINTITNSEWFFIRDNDSIAMSWFCLGEATVVPKYYIIDLQGMRANDAGTEYDFESFLKNMKCRYKILIKLSHSKDTVRSPVDKINEMLGFGIIFNVDLKSISSRGSAIFNSPVESCWSFGSSLAYAVHMAVWMRYKKVIFYGVDLYDQNYFWMNKGEQWSYLTIDGLKSDELHPHAESTVIAISEIMNLFPDVEWVVHNPKSLLRTHANIIS
jgi:hypothetical protein